MGLFTGLSRLAKGEPVFQPGDDDWNEKSSYKDTDGSEPYAQPEGSDATADITNDGRGALRDSRGQKLYPQVVVDKVNCHLSGNYMDCYFGLQNNARTPIELDKITILGTTRELDCPLQPGEQRDFQVYNGVCPTNNYANKCQIYYKDPAGDYFMSEHLIDFEQNPDKSYYIYRVRFIGPVRDV